MPADDSVCGHSWGKIWGASDKSLLAAPGRGRCPGRRCGRRDPTGGIRYRVTTMTVDGLAQKYGDAIKRLRKQREPVTVRSVLDEAGGGSFRDAAPGVRAWKKQQAAEHDQRVVATMLRAVWVEARKSVDVVDMVGLRRAFVRLHHELTGKNP